LICGVKHIFAPRFLEVDVAERIMKATEAILTPLANRVAPSDSSVGTCRDLRLELNPADDRFSFYGSALIDEVFHVFEENLMTTDLGIVRSSRQIETLLSE
jgi:hypothetical protein